MISIKKLNIRLSRILSSIVIVAAQMVPFFVFSAPRAGALDTGFKYPTSVHGDNDWDTNTVANVQSSDNVYASDNDNQEQDWSNFDFPAIPAGSTIDGVEIRIEAKSSDSASCDMGMRVSWNNGTSNTSSSTADLTDNDTVFTFGGATNTLGRTWTVSDFTNANFVLKTSGIDTSNNCTNNSTTYIDQIQVKVYYTIPTFADLVVVKTNNAINNSILIGGAFNWTLSVTNNGDASAVFNNQNILRDNMPTGATYSPTNNIPVTTGGGTTGSIDCDIVGANNNDLVCDDNPGGSSVIIPAGGWFSVTFTVSSDSVGDLANPRSGGGNICRVDPDSAITESNEQNNNCSNTVSVTQVQPIANPTLGQSCGLDIALVLDNSTSIDSGELASMKSAMTAFTSAFAGTSTHFSVTKFATTGSVVQPFTGDINAVNNAINSIPQGGGSTNWEDGLAKAHSTFDPRLDKANLVVFASDGNPNRVDDGTSVSEAQAVNEAIIVANTIKGAPLNAHIMALGIGNDLNVANLEAISGVGDVVTSNFATLAQDLSGIAVNLCGGTISATKLVDGDGDLSTTDDQTPASGWEFTVSGNPSNPDSVTTDAEGETTGVEVDPGTYEISESPQYGYTVLSASCTVNNQTIGSWAAGDSRVTGMSIDENDIVSCVFINTFNQGTLIVKKFVTNDNGNKEPKDFSFRINDSEVMSFEEDGQNEMVVNAGTYTIVEEDSYFGYEPYYDNCYEVQVVAGQTTTCTITNDYQVATIVVTKFHDYNENNYRDEGEPVLPDWDITLTPCENDKELRTLVMMLDCNALQTQTESTDENGESQFLVTPGYYEVDEILQDGWHQNGIYCDQGESDMELSLSESISPSNQVYAGAGQTIYCYVANHRAPKVEIVKSNNTTGYINRGSEVKFTIVVKVGDVTTSGSLEGALDGLDYYPVTVVDNMNNELTYIAGSFTANSSIRGDLKAQGITTDPNYHSPGTWVLTSLASNTMIPGEVVTLTYKAIVKQTANAGISPTIATVKGYGQTIDIVVTATDPDEIRISVPAVLGTSTKLASTGENTLVELFIGLTVVIFGFSVLKQGIKQNR